MDLREHRPLVAIFLLPICLPDIIRYPGDLGHSPGLIGRIRLCRSSCKTLPSTRLEHFRDIEAEEGWEDEPLLLRNLYYYPRYKQACDFCFPGVESPVSLHEQYFGLCTSTCRSYAGRSRIDVCLRVPCFHCIHVQLRAIRSATPATFVQGRCTPHLGQHRISRPSNSLDLPGCGWGEATPR